MAGVDQESDIDINSKFTDDHLFCDSLFCHFVFNGHISYITVDYRIKTMQHDDPWCELHESDILLNGMERFINSHHLWRQAHHLPTRNGLTEDTSWTKKRASREACPQQEDSISCGLFTCASATLRVLDIPQHYFTQYHIPLMRLHVYHRIMNNILYPLVVDQMTEHTRGQLVNTNIWYRQHRENHAELLRLRRSRPLPKYRNTPGQGTISTPFIIDSDSDTTSVSVRALTPTYITSTIKQDEQIVSSINQTTILNDHDKKRRTTSHRRRTRRRRVTAADNTHTDRLTDVSSESLPTAVEQQSLVIDQSLPPGKRIRDIREFFNQNREISTEKTNSRRKRAHARGE